MEQNAPLPLGGGAGGEGQPLRESAQSNDGYPLAITRFPAEGEAWATMVIAGAMAVRQEFYAPLARHFAAAGIHVLTFDYRGIGRSRPARLAALEADVTTWAEQDLDAMLRAAREPAPGLPLAVLGHSLGGQIMGLAPRNTEVAAMVTVSAGSGWYRHNDRMPLRVRVFWHLAVPLATPLFGYFPGKALRMVGDLPAGVARQWRRWCLHPDYALSEGAAARAGFERFTAPILAWSFEDDDIITRPAVERLHGFYPNAPLERRHVAPGDVGGRAIGHFGFFSEASRTTLWTETARWLEAVTGGAAGTAGPR